DSLIYKLFDDCEDIPDSTRYLLHELIIDNNTKRSNYSKVLETYKQLEGVDSDYITMQKKPAYRNMITLYDPLKTKLPLRVVKGEEYHYIPFHKNGMGHYVLPVSHGNVTEDFVFDSGANMSVITESMADSMDMDILNSGLVDVGTSIDGTVKAKIAFADQLNLGNLIVENCAFLVLPDSILDFKEVNYKIKGIIGYPVMREMGEMIISKQGIMSIPPVPVYKKKSNLFMDGQSPILKAEYKNQTVQLLFDTGSTGTQMYASFYTKYDIDTKRYGDLTTINIGGAGGSTRVTCFAWKDFPLTIADYNIQLPLVHVLITPLGLKRYVSDGVIGQNMAEEYEEMIINFKDMYLTFDKKIEK
ncbi:MAG: aspartyl protease family protein, partial [Bacteroidales bacterium]